ncbi:MAG TPA: hypothetical protein VMX77_01780 [Candidatus Bathyarchaeia archaeon]|nr:hypothetical protein [Candidatus Bathyarchaeia archaeon]
MNSLKKAYLEETTATFSLPIPPGGQISVKKGASVSAGQVVAKGKRAVVKRIDLVKTLGVAPKKVLDVLVKSLGSEVAKGEVIAKTKTFLKTKELVSPIAGVLESLSETGVLKIKMVEDEFEVKAPLAGKIIVVGEGRVEVSFAARKIAGIWGAGGEAFGILATLGSPQKEVTVFDLKESFKEKIVAFSGKLTHGFWHKAVSCGVAGLVCGSLPNEEFGAKLEGDSLLVPGGQEELVLPLVVAGSGQEGPIKDEIWQMLIRSQEKTVVIKGKEKSLLVPK